MPRFPPRGPLGRLFPRFDGTIKALRLPAAHPAAFRFLHLAVPRDHAAFAPVVAARQPRAWGWSPGIPVRAYFRGDNRISQVPGGPNSPLHMFSDPGRSWHPRPIAECLRGPRYRHDEGTDDDNTFEAQ